MNHQICMIPHETNFMLVLFLQWRLYRVSGELNNDMFIPITVSTSQNIQGFAKLITDDSTFIPECQVWFTKEITINDLLGCQISAFCSDPWGQALTLCHLWDVRIVPLLLLTRDPSECSMSQLAQEGLSPAHLISQAVLALDGRGDTHSDESSTSPRARCCSLLYCTSKT